MALFEAVAFVGTDWAHTSEAWAPKKATEVKVEPSFYPTPTYKEFINRFLHKFLPEYDHSKDLIHYYAPDATFTHRILIDANNQFSHAMPRRVLKGGIELAEYLAVGKPKTLHSLDDVVYEVSFAQETSVGHLILFHVSGKGFLSSDNVMRSVQFYRSLFVIATGSSFEIQNDAVQFVIKPPQVESAMAARFPPREDSSDLECSPAASANRLVAELSAGLKKSKKRHLHADLTSEDVLVEMETEEAKAASAELAGVLKGKTATSFLHELAQKRGYPALTWAESTVSADPQHPLFVFAAVFNGEEMAPGRGRNKKLAKEAGARLALLQLLKRPGQLVDGKKAPKSAEPGDVPMEPALDISERTKTIIAAAEEKKKNAISVLQEYYQKKFKESPTYDDLDGFPPNNLPFHAVCIGPDGERFPVGSARSKKIARVYAASLAINKLVTENRWTFIGSGANAVVPMRKLENKKFKSDVFGLVGKYVHETFVSLVKVSKDKAVIESGKVVSGIVMMDDVNKAAFVVSMATGNRCVRGDLVSTHGDVLNDCHAEILARRGLKRFLFKQCSDYAAFLRQTTENQTIFEDSYSAAGKLQVKKRYTFHLYINTAPCGDGRTFTLAEPNGKDGPTNVSEHRPVLKDPRKHGVLRSKIERGEGTIPVGDIGTQTLDGIGGGERLRTMSCSDKILMWNAVGLQGTLLSSFLEPLYLDSITIGSLSHHGHMSRAVCCRASTFAAPPPTLSGSAPYQIRHPHLGSAQDISHLEDRDCHKKSSGLSINWNFADQSMETVDGTEGKLVGTGAMSRLCRRSMLEATKTLLDAAGQTLAVNCRPRVYCNVAVNWRAGEEEAFGRGRESLANRHYREVKKMLGFDYVTAKNAFIKYLQGKGCGTWLRRPVEEQMFS